MKLLTAISWLQNGLFIRVQFLNNRLGSHPIPRLEHPYPEKRTRTLSSNCRVNLRFLIGCLKSCDCYKKYISSISSIALSMLNFLKESSLVSVEKFILGKIKSSIIVLVKHIKIIVLWLVLFFYQEFSRYLRSLFKKLLWRQIADRLSRFRGSCRIFNTS